MVAELARRFQARIELVTRDGRRVTSTDVLQILSLGCAQGEPLELVVDGDDAQAAIEAMVQLFASRFGEDMDQETTADAT